MPPHTVTLGLDPRVQDNNKDCHSSAFFLPTSFSGLTRESIIRQYVFRDPRVRHFMPPEDDGRKGCYSQTVFSMSPSGMTGSIPTKFRFTSLTLVCEVKSHCVSSEKAQSCAFSFGRLRRSSFMSFSGVFFLPMSFSDDEAKNCFGEAIFNADYACVSL